MNFDFKFEEIQKNWLINYLGLKDYNYLINELKNVNVSTDIDYQRTFNSFYKIRRNEDWRKIFYSYFEENKYNKNLTFEDIIRHLYDKTGNVEASFSSKLLATINPKMPIWDQYVVKNINLNLLGNTKEERLQNAIDLYDKIIEEFNILLERGDVQNSIKQIKTLIGEYEIEDVKILDFILWSIRYEKQ